MGKTLGIIGGSGFYSLEGLQGVEEIEGQTPFGKTPDPLKQGRLGDAKAIFAARHGDGHRLLPSEVPYRANVFALKAAEAEFVIGVSAVGSLKEGIKPGDLALVGQLANDTCPHLRPPTFFGDGIVAHVGRAKPCPVLAALVAREAQKAGERFGFAVHQNAFLKVMEGPAFSSVAESRRNIAAGFDLVGMTSEPEDTLCREAEMCRVTLAIVTDYDCWRPEEEGVTGAMVAQRIAEGVDKVKVILKAVALALPAARSCACSTVLDAAVVTNPRRIPAWKFKTLAPILARWAKAKGIVVG